MARKCSKLVGSKRKMLDMDNEDCQVISRAFFDFPLDIISEILSRLPIKSLLRCRSVCKKWYELTENPGFTIMQLDRSRNRAPCFINHHLSAFHTPTREYPYYILKTSPVVKGRYAKTLFIVDTAKDKEAEAIKIRLKKGPFQGLQIMSSCNGLLCFAANETLNRVLICNPVTDEVVFLPSSDKVSNLLFHRVSLCYEASGHKYSAVRAYGYMNKKNQVTFFEIFSAGERSWRKLSPPHGIDEFEIFRPVLWKDFVHWRIGRKVYHNKCGRECILSFDPNEKKFQMIALPLSVQGLGLCHCKYNLQLEVLNGRLTLIELEDTIMKLWEVIGNEVGDLSLVCRKTFDTHVKWGGLFRCSLLSSSIQNGNLLKVRYGKSAPSGSLISHFVVSSPEMTEFKPLEIHGLPDHFDTFSYTPSLVSPVSHFASIKCIGEIKPRHFQVTRIRLRAAKQGWKPTYVDFDIGLGSIASPFGIVATPFQMPVDLIEGNSLEMLSVYDYCRTIRSGNTELFAVLC